MYAILICVWVMTNLMEALMEVLMKAPVAQIAREVGMCIHVLP
jgi:hypothetical protein